MKNAAEGDAPGGKDDVTVCGDNAPASLVLYAHDGAALLQQLQNARALDYLHMRLRL